MATILIGANVFFFLAGEVLSQLDDTVLSLSPATYGQGLAELLLRGALAPSPDCGGV